MHRWMAIDFFLLVESTICRISKSNQRRIQRYNERHLILFETFFCFQGLKVWHQIIGISLANFPSFIWIYVNFFFVILLLVCWNLIYTIFWVIFFFYIFRVVGYSNYNGGFLKTHSRIETFLRWACVQVQERISEHFHNNETTKIKWSRIKLDAIQWNPMKNQLNQSFKKRTKQKQK